MSCGLDAVKQPVCLEVAMGNSRQLRAWQARTAVTRLGPKAIPLTAMSARLLYNPVTHASPGTQGT